jgi:hypothetical protein
MIELFTETSSWSNVATRNWSIAGGESVGLGVVLGGEAKILVFTHNDLGKKKGFLMLSGSFGGRAEAVFPAEPVLGVIKGGKLEKLLELAGHAKRFSDGTGVDPFNYSPPIKVNVTRPFSVSELRHAVAGSWSSGTSAGVVDAGLALFSFHSTPDGRQLFSMEEATLRGIIGVGINASSIQGSVLIDLQRPPNARYFQDTGSKKGQWYRDTGKI